MQHINSTPKGFYQLGLYCYIPKGGISIQMRKPQVLEALATLGVEDPGAVFTEHFSSVKMSERNDVLTTIVSVLEKAQEAQMSQTNSNVSVTIEPKFSDKGYLLRLLCTPSNATGKTRNINAPLQAASATNAAVDYFHFGAEFGYGEYLEPGLHCRIDPSDLTEDDYEERFGVISRSYKGKHADEMFEFGDAPQRWSYVTWTGYEYVLSKVDGSKDHPKYGAPEKNPFSKFGNVARKHATLDWLLKGITLNISMWNTDADWKAKVGQTISGTDENGEVVTKEEAWDSYQTRKNESANKSNDFKAGQRKIERTDDGEIDLTQEVTVTINGEDKTLELGKLPVDVVITSYRNVDTSDVDTSLFFEGKESHLVTIVGALSKGYAVVISG